MSRRLPDQLDAYFSDVDANQGPVTPDQVAHLLERVRELPPNPIPDPAGLDSAKIERRSLPMAIDEPISTELTPTKPERGRNRRNGLLVGAAAAVAVLAVGLASWALISGNDDNAVASEVDVVLSSYEALNNADIDGWFALFTEEAAAGETRALQQVLVNMNSQTEFLEPCRLLEPSPSTGESRVECTVTATNEFQGPAGLADTVTDTFHLTDTRKINLLIKDIDHNPFFEEYNRAFWDWLTVAHPNVYADITPIDGISLPGWSREPADMLTALDYVDEFIAQSDVYPVTDAGTP